VAAHRKTSGRRQGRPAAGQDGEYVFRPERHYVGKVKILGFTHANSSSDPKTADAVIDSYIYLALSIMKYIARSWPPGRLDTPPKSSWTGWPRRTPTRA
jgi:hypothetical protein